MTDFYCRIRNVSDVLGDQPVVALDYLALGSMSAIEEFATVNVGALRDRLLVVVTDYRYPVALRCDIPFCVVNVPRDAADGIWRSALRWAAAVAKVPGFEEHAPEQKMVSLTAHSFAGTWLAHTRPTTSGPSTIYKLVTVSKEPDGTDE